MRIGELARRTGVSPRSLRYYEQRGLLLSGRTPSGQRVYAEDAVERVGCLAALLRTGMSTASILEMLPCMTSPSRSTIRAAEETMLRERERLTTAMADLGAARDALDRLMEGHRSRQGVSA
ncbi:MerR family transcriptional regulator [Pseudokineococcus sp. 1T1Z-3]|uniref:MerR family transcriptional regulator n=1 Tax=Pseudokineococcus sp. 1T1Z-3 TaxID=3132745 RepID=UPI00309A07EF